VQTSKSTRRARSTCRCVRLGRWASVGLEVLKRATPCGGESTFLHAISRHRRFFSMWLSATSTASWSVTSGYVARYHPEIVVIHSTVPK